MLAGCASGPDESGAAPAARAGAGTATAAPPVGLRGRTELNGYRLPVRYTAADGDTWESIASHFRMTPEILKSFNESASVAAGQEIDLRGVSVPQLGAAGDVAGHDGQGQLLYRVGAGDTPAGIASRYGVPLYALRMANLDLLTGSEWIPPAGTTLSIPSAPAG
jgi:LysM repeat protein